MSNYFYELFRIIHPVDLYPVTVADYDPSFIDSEYLNPKLPTESAFVEWLKDKLSSPATLQIVRALIAQSS